MRMMLRALTFVLLLHLASGAKITSIQTFRRSVDAKVGHLLVIPCVFNKDEPLQGHEIELEWGMTPENGGEYRPLILLKDTMPMPVLHPNPRARLNPMRLPSGQCALEIDPVKLEDSGTYTIRLAIDGEEYKEVPEVKVHVWEFHKETESSPERFSLPIDQPKKDQLLRANGGVLHSKSPSQRPGLSTHHQNEANLLRANGGVLHSKSPPQRLGLSTHHQNEANLLRANGGVLHSKSPPQRLGLSTHHQNEDNLLRANGGVFHAKSSPQQPGLSTHHPNEDNLLRANAGVLHAKSPPQRPGLSDLHPNEDNLLRANGGLLHAKLPPQQPVLSTHHAKSPPKRSRLSTSQLNEANDHVLHTESSLEGLGLSNDQPKMDRSLQANDGVRHAKSLPKQSGHPNDVHSLGANGKLPSDHNINPTISEKAKVLQAVENCGSPWWLVIVLGVFNLLLLMFSGPAYYFACKYLLLMSRKERAPRMAKDNNDNNVPTVVVQ